MVLWRRNKYSLIVGFQDELLSLSSGGGAVNWKQSSYTCRGLINWDKDFIFLKLLLWTRESSGTQEKEGNSIESDKLPDVAECHTCVCWGHWCRGGINRTGVWRDRYSTVKPRTFFFSFKGRERSHWRLLNRGVMRLELYFMNLIKRQSVAEGT